MFYCNKLIFIIVILELSSAAPNSFKVSSSNDQELNLYEGPKNYYNSKKVLPSFILTSKPFIAQERPKYFEGSKKPDDWEPIQTYLIDCKAGEKCQQVRLIDINYFKNCVINLSDFSRS